MTTTEQLERDLTTWFTDTALPSTPDYADDILLETAGIRQRPGWTFVPPLSRPMHDAVLGRLAMGATEHRLAIVLALVALVLVGLGVFLVGSAPRVPAPFGRAANGLVAYEKAGDIFTVDPETDERHVVSFSSDQDHDPRFSLDGTRLAFLRGTGPDRLVVANLDGNEQSVTMQVPNIDGDSIAWSPDSRTIAFGGGREDDRSIYLVDAASGHTTILPVDYGGLEILWRPPDGRELTFLGKIGERWAFYRYSLASGTMTEIPTTSSAAKGDFPIRPIGWTPDGARFAYHRNIGDLTLAGGTTHVVDVAAGTEVVLQVGWGRISNDGSRIVGVETGGRRLCVASVDGGVCTPIQGDQSLVDISGSGSWQWAPDDRKIRTEVPDGRVHAILLDPDGGPIVEPDWTADGAASWQRK